MNAARAYKLPKLRGNVSIVNSHVALSESPRHGAASASGESVADFHTPPLRVDRPRSITSARHGGEMTCTCCSGSAAHKGHGRPGFGVRW